MQGKQSLATRKSENKEDKMGKYVCRAYSEKKKMVAYLATVKHATKVDLANAIGVGEGRALTLMCSTPWLVERVPQATHQRQFVCYRLRNDVASGAVVSMSRAQWPDAVVDIAHALQISGPMTMEELAKRVNRSVVDTRAWLGKMQIHACEVDGKWRLQEDGPWFVVPPRRVVEPPPQQSAMPLQQAKETPLHRLVRVLAGWTDADCEAAMRAVALRQRG